MPCSRCFVPFLPLKKRGRVSESGLRNGLRVDCLARTSLPGLDLAGLADQDEDEIVLREILLDDSARIGHCHGIDLRIVRVDVVFIQAIELEPCDGGSQLARSLDAGRN